MRKSVEFRVTAWGHPNILSSHKSTWQLTKEKEISKRADCIIGVKADVSAHDIPEELKAFIHAEEEFDIILRIGDLSFTGSGRGDKGLALQDPNDMVFRKSEFLSDRTVLIGCTFAAKDIPPDMKKKLKDSRTKIEVILKVKKC